MPSSRFFQSRVQSFYGNLKLLSFQIAPQGTGTPLLVSGASQGVASVSRSGAGALLVTLQDQYVALIEGSADVQLATFAAADAQLGAADVVVAKTVAITTFDPATGAAIDIAAAAGNLINVELQVLQRF